MLSLEIFPKQMMSPGYSKKGGQSSNTEGAKNVSDLGHTNRNQGKTVTGGMIILKIKIQSRMISTKRNRMITINSC